jgi:hypothetical protein
MTNEAALKSCVRLCRAGTATVKAPAEAAALHPF